MYLLGPSFTILAHSLGPFLNEKAAQYVSGEILKQTEQGANVETAPLSSQPRSEVVAVERFAVTLLARTGPWWSLFSAHLGVNQLRIEGGCLNGGQYRVS